jgi:hypothetical protein
MTMASATFLVDVCSTMTSVQCAQALNHIGKDECHVPDGMKWALELVVSMLFCHGICRFFTLTNHLFLRKSNCVDLF